MNCIVKTMTAPGDEPVSNLLLCVNDRPASRQVHGNRGCDGVRRLEFGPEGFSRRDVAVVNSTLMTNG